MTAATYQIARPGASRGRPAHRLSFGGAVASEWIKLRSSRSTWWNVFLLWALSCGLAVITASALSSIAVDGIGSMAEVSKSDGYAAAVANQNTTMVGTVIALVLGVLAVSSEYASGSIKTTLSSDPRRGMVLAAKSVVTVGVAATAAVVAELVALLVVKTVFKTGPLEFHMGQVGWRAIFGAVLYLVCVALIGIGLGFALRSSTGAISLGLGVFFVVDMLLSFMGHGAVVRFVEQITPTGAAQLLYAGPMIDPKWDVLGGFWGGAACLGAWTALALAGGYLVLKKRDA